MVSGNADLNSANPVFLENTVFRTLLFWALFLFMWISINPFVDLTGDLPTEIAENNSNKLNQLIALTLSGLMIVFGVTHPLRSLLVQPRALIVFFTGWFFFTSLISEYPIDGIKGVILSTLMMINAAVFLLLPQSELQFAKWLGVGIFIVLIVSYFGIIFIPTLSIHQASELLEPMNAGFWRGHFPHKNTAATAMTFACFFALFVSRVWSKTFGLLLFLLSALFLFNTGGKTASMLLPFSLFIAFVFEKIRFSRTPIILFGVAAFNFLVIGAAVIRPVRELIVSMGIDATFTNRADIWRFAIDKIVERPITGQGLRAFWQKDALVFGGGDLETWAVAAANGHNSFIEITLATGLVGLVFAVLWILIWPLHSYSKIPDSQKCAPLTRLYLRIWLFTMFTAGLETFFFEGGNPSWFMCMVAMFGLYFQANAHMVSSSESVNSTSEC